MNKAILIDRDGVINNNSSHYYIRRTEDLVINPGVITTLQELQKRGYLLIIITNQGGISKEEVTWQEAEEVNRRLVAILEENHIQVRELYCCPHHPSRENCLCRKPEPLMMEKAIARFELDVSASYAIGDSERDIQAGAQAGLKTIRVPSNGNLERILERIS